VVAHLVGGSGSLVHRGNLVLSMLTGKVATPDEVIQRRIVYW
jgi:hypothetical protein